MKKDQHHATENLEQDNEREKLLSADETIHAMARNVREKASGFKEKKGREKKKTRREQKANPFPIKKTEESTAQPLTPVDPKVGLTEEQLKERQERGMVNVVERKGVRTTKQIVLSHTITYFNLLNLFLGFLVFLTGEYKNMLFMGVIITNSVIGIVQELKVKQLIDKLSVITVAKAVVLRDGQAGSIPVDEIVVDDIVRVVTGDQVATDGVVLGGRGLEVNESMLTGESKPVKKRKGDPILSGSFIVAGTGVMQVQKVGNDCYASELVDKASSRHRASSEMQNAIKRIIQVVSILIVPIGLLLYRSQRVAALVTAQANNYSDRWVFNESINHAVSGVIGMIPEGLVLLTSVSFILGVGRLAYKRALVQEMEAIEALARVNILCTDKTGTITTGELEVSRVISLSDAEEQEITEIIAHLNGAFSDTNATQEAVNKYFGSVKGWETKDTVPFSSERKYKGAAFSEHGSFLIGAPEYIAPDREEILEQVEEFSKQGLRVLLLAKTTELSSESAVSGEVTPLALVVLSDVIKEDAREIFDYFKDAGVQIKVLSGDNPATVSAVAVKAGVEGAEKYVDASDLPNNPIAMAQEIAKYNVFGRVKPEQKQEFVKAWQTNGNTVAMVGDGVNDVLAIKDADCGIAMANGSEAAKQAAHIVLLDSDFSSMRDIVKEGKTIISNIERVSALYLTKTIYSCLLCVIFILLRSTYPWTTLQMGLINMVGIGVPSFLLTLEQHENWKAQGFLKHVLKVCLPASLTMVVMLMVIQILHGLFGWEQSIYSYFNLMIGAVVSLLVVGQVCWPVNRFRGFVLGISLLIFLGAIIFLPGFYEIHSIWTPWTLLLIPLVLLAMMIVYWISRWTNRLTDWYEERQNSKESYSP